MASTETRKAPAMWSVQKSLLGQGQEAPEIDHRKKPKFDMVGQSFSGVKVIAYYGFVKDKHYWKCECICKGPLVLPRRKLLIRSSLKCRCLNGKGRSYTQTYTCWQQMWQRCINPKMQNWENYGGRGITVCKRWEQFYNFLEDMGECPDGLSIDRINNDGNYEPDNCQWANALQQSRNRRNTTRLEFQGKNLTVHEWAEVTGICVGTIFARIYAEWKVEDILTLPPDRTRRLGNGRRKKEQS